jgi:multiple antibiotic resistance protein
MLEYAATVFVTLLVIVDPVAVLPIYIALTQRQSKERRRQTAIRAITVATSTMMVLAVAGGALLSLLGIGLPAFRIAGGLLLFLLSIDMVFARQSGLRSATEAETHEAEVSYDVAVFPLGIPLIAGPGAMTSIILIMGQASSDIVMQAIVILVMLCVLALSLATFLFAAPLMDRLGVTGINVIGRVFGIVLAALAVQYVIDGVGDVLMPRPSATGAIMTPLRSA